MNAYTSLLFWMIISSKDVHLNFNNINLGDNITFIGTDIITDRNCTLNVRRASRIVSSIFQKCVTFACYVFLKIKEPRLLIRVR